MVDWVVTDDRRPDVIELHQLALNQLTCVTIAAPNSVPAAVF